VTIRRFAVAATLAVSAVLLVSCGDDTTSKSLSGAEVYPPPVVGTLALPDASQGDADFPFAADDGHLLIVYFGYTSCPDVCPTTLAEVKKALQQIGDDADKVDLAMATIDPDRDSGEILTGYVQSFIPGSHALRTEDPAALQTTANAFGVSYSVTTTADGTVEVSHTGNLYVVDDTGTVVLTWLFGIPADGIATDLEILFDRSAS
jgi:protein SCO1/2